MGSIGNTQAELAEALERWQSDEFTERRAIDGNNR